MVYFSQLQAVKKFVEILLMIINNESGNNDPLYYIKNGRVLFLFEKKYFKKNEFRLMYI